MNDIKINVAIGASAESRSWKNKQMLWSELKRRLADPVVTPETHKEFINMSKSDQHKVKDVGGYVGGYLLKGRRLQSHVQHRQLITLDIDFAHNNFWSDFQMMYDVSAVLHATHKHIETSPRYRLVIPLDREVSPDEYCAIARQLAGMLDIELFDNTTFDPCRLMFWPSTPRDVDYYFEHQDGPILCADDILDTYYDWTDVSLWPTSGETLREITDRSKKQEDPTLKKGVIGAFCRTYSISDAIEKFLPEEYVPSIDGRYTYAKGTTASGVVIYDDKFVFSHHGTDPISGKLCNSFDLVRHHKFGYLDTDGEDGVNAKSFKSMEEFVLNDSETKKTLAKERLESAMYDFVEPLNDDDELNEWLDEEDYKAELREEDVNWLSTLEVDKQGNPLSTANNLNIIFQNDQRMKKVFRYNLFDSRSYVFSTLPWRRIPTPEPIRNVDFSGVRNYIESIYKISGAMKIEDALNLEFERNSYHPVREYLSGLTWDGVERIDKLMIEYFGAPDNPYSRESIRAVLVGGVRRIFEPGCKMDLVLTLVGGQGCGKSTFVRKMGVNWYSDTFITVQGKEAMEQINSGVWLMEIPELAGFKKSEVETVKHFLSKQKDDFRPAYGRTSETFKRQCIFIGTTNDETFLRDQTGNRRFLPIDVKLDRRTKCPIEGLKPDEVSQIWAEAYQLYRKGLKPILSKEAETLAVSEQLSHTLIDERIGLIDEFLNMEITESWDKLELGQRLDFIRNEEIRKDATTIPREIVCIAEIWTECLGKRREDMTPYNTKELNALMKSFDDWEPVKKAKRFKLYGPQKYYARKF